MQKHVVARVAGTFEVFRTDSHSTDLSIRVPVEGKDELSGLSVDINRTLDVLENAHIALVGK